jgi:hypothetical protein
VSLPFLPGAVAALIEFFMNQDTTFERRSGRDRRQGQIKWYKFFLFPGNRRMVRRVDDRKRVILLDRYEPALLLSVVIVLSLSLMDGMLTLFLVERGAVELNPVMRYYLTLGPTTFLMAKYGITALALFILVGLHNITFSERRIGIFLLPFCKLTFGSVVIWELFLLSR